MEQEKVVGIIVAMEEEMKAIEAKMKDTEEIKRYELQIIKGKIAAQTCIAVKCGVGKVNSARVTQILIDNFKIKYIINMGAAGALDDNLQIGDIVIGDKLVQHDFDITAFGHDKGYITGVGKEVKSDKQLTKRLTQIVNNKTTRNYQVEIGTIASGDIFCTEIEMKEKIHQKFDAKCVEMEGAAIGQVCHLNKIPFLVIRSISDSPNGKNAITFDEFVTLASERCASLIKEFLEKE